MTNKEKDKLLKSWRTIVAILHETGYDFMYQDEITEVRIVLEKIINKGGDK